MKPSEPLPLDYATPRHDQRQTLSPPMAMLATLVSVPSLLAGVIWIAAALASDDRAGLPLYLCGSVAIVIGSLIIWLAVRGLR